MIRPVLAVGSVAAGLQAGSSVQLEHAPPVPPALPLAGLQSQPPTAAPQLTRLQQIVVTPLLFFTGLSISMLKGLMHPEQRQTRPMHAFLADVFRGGRGIMQNTLYGMQNQFLFAPNKRIVQRPLRRVKCQPHVQRHIIPTPDGQQLRAWYVPGPPGRPVIVHAHGNSGNLGSQACKLDALASLGVGVLTFDYRGYGKSSGAPLEEGLYTDFKAASDYVAKHLEVPIANQIAFGESLGGAVVIDVASKAKTPFKAVVLSCTFTSARDMAQNFIQSSQALRLLPYRDWILASLPQKFDSLAKISGIQSPILIVHGTADQVIPERMGKQLFNRIPASRAKAYLPLVGMDHGDLFTKPNYTRQFLAQLKTLCDSPS